MLPLLVHLKFFVGSNAEGGLVCLLYQDEIMATAFVEDGLATLQFPELETLGSITITITAFNFIPHIGNIQIIQPDGPYLVYDDHNVIDLNGNNNGNVDYGESITLDLTLEIWVWKMEQTYKPVLFQTAVGSA